MNENKEISKWMRRECKYHAHSTSRAARNVDRYFETKIIPKD